MYYTSYEDLSDCLRRNAWKVPHDVELIVGVPRSGMIPALMLSELLGIRCTDLYTFTEGREAALGRRQKMLEGGKTGKVLVLDDTVYSGTEMRRVREKLEPMKWQYEFIFGCIYTDGRHAKEHVDLYFEDLWRPGEKRFYYEWNVLHHYEDRTIESMWDIDGLLCKNPPDDRNTAAYEAYLPEALPMVIPTTKVGALVTYRIEKYREVTEAWLRGQGVTYGALHMFPAPTREVRNKAANPAEYKAQIYRNAAWAKLFYESDAWQAERIQRMAGKPVWCYENGRMYV